MHLKQTENKPKTYPSDNKHQTPKPGLVSFHNIRLILYYYINTPGTGYY